MYRSLITSALILIYVSAYSQKVESLKKSSENHSNKSGNSGSRGNSSGQGSSGNGAWGGSSQIDPSCIAGGCNLLFDILSNIDYSETYSPEPDPPEPPSKRESNNEVVAPDSLPDAIPPVPIPNPNKPSPNHEYQKKPYDERNTKMEDTHIDPPFEKMSFSVRGSFYPADYQVWIPEITLTNEHLSFSARWLGVADQGLNKTEYYSTFDVQPFQINFVNHHDFLLKIGVGGMAETFSNNIYFEFTSNVKWRIGEKFDMGVEGRMATNNGIVRQEASMQVNYALWQKSNKQFLVGLNGMVSEYYETVSINTLSFSAGFRF